MRNVRYVTLDPTGNLTCLVLDRVRKDEEAEITRRLMGECEQVAYLEEATREGSRARIRLMGGEFCGNAAMASACYLASLDGTETGIVTIDVSGADAPVACSVRKEADGCWTGCVEMPRITRTETVREAGMKLTSVAMEGIRHFIAERGNPETDFAEPVDPVTNPAKTEGPATNPAKTEDSETNPAKTDHPGIDIPETGWMEKKQAEALLRKLAAEIPEGAAGLLQWNRERGEMLPLVLVKGSDTLVWENGCGSGSAAIGAYEALQAHGSLTETARGDNTRKFEATATGADMEWTTETAVKQPGGVIRAAATVCGERVKRVTITGFVRFRGEAVIGAADDRA